MSKLPAISDPYPTLDGLYESVRSLKIAVETLAGQRAGGGSIMRYIQDTQPSDQKEGDVWINTADPGRTYYWNGSYWVDISESRFKQLADVASSSKLQDDEKKVLLDDFWAELLDEHHKISEEIDAAIEESRTEFNAAVIEAQTAIETVQTDVDLARDEASAALLEAKGYLEDAINGVATDGAILKTRVDNLSVSSGGTAAAVDQEAIARVAGDNALAAQITTLTSTVNGNKALFDNEIVTRANADSALSAQITTVSAVASKQRVFSQATSPSSSDRIAGDIWIDTANNNRINVWDGTSWSLKEDPRIAQLNAAITSEQVARSNADTALAADITTVSAAANKQRVFNQSTAPTATGRLVGDLWFASHEGFKPYYWNGTAWADNSDNRFTTIAASVTSEAAARTTADTAIGTRIDSLTSTVNGNTAAISAEQVTRANADTALSSQLTSLTSTVNTNKAAFDNEVVTRASADTALSGQVTSLTTTVNNNKASLDNEIIARTNADTAISSNVSTLTTTVNGHTSQISTVQSSYNGIAVKYGVTGTINQQTGGFVLTGIGKNDGSASYLLEITANVVINGNLLVNGTVTTGKAADRAFTEGNWGNGTWLAECDVTAKQAGDAFLVIGSYVGGAVSGGNSFGYGGGIFGNLTFDIQFTSTSSFASVPIRGFMYNTYLVCNYFGCASQYEYMTSATTFMQVVYAQGVGNHHFRVFTSDSNYLAQGVRIAVIRLSK